MILTLIDLYSFGRRVPCAKLHVPIPTMGQGCHRASLGTAQQQESRRKQESGTKNQPTSENIRICILYCTLSLNKGGVYNINRVESPHTGVDQHIHRFARIAFDNYATEALVRNYPWSKYTRYTGTQMPSCIAEHIRRSR